MPDFRKVPIGEAYRIQQRNLLLNNLQHFTRFECQFVLEIAEVKVEPNLPTSTLRALAGVAIAKKIDVTKLTFMKEPPKDAHQRMQGSKVRR